MADTRASRSTSPMPATANAVTAAPATAWLTPERVARAEFRSGFRGLDAAEVRAFLARVASELRSLLERESELVARLEQAEARNTAAVPAPLDIHQVSELLGQETARVLETAREAAADIKARAASDADATLEAATAEADRLREQAEGMLAERTAEADLAAATIRQEADAEASRLVADAEERAAAHVAAAEADASRLRAEAEAALERAREDAAATREAAREEGKRMVAEARAVRERVLTDMARRRNVARQQLERVRAARERLLEAIDAVRQGVADTHSELSGSLVEAKLAGDRAARTVDVEDIPALRELDAEVELAKDTGLIDLTSIESSSEDFSAVETGEFAAVTAPEPAVDRPGEPAGGHEGAPTAAVPVVVIDDATAAPDDAPAADAPAAVGTETGAPTSVDGAAAAGDKGPAPTPARGGEPVRPARPAAGRTGGIEVVRRTVVAGSKQPEPTAAPVAEPAGTASDTTTGTASDTTADTTDSTGVAGGDTSGSGSEAASSTASVSPAAAAATPAAATADADVDTAGPSGDAAVIDLRDAPASDPSGGPAGPSGGEPGVRDAEHGGRRSQRRALKDADKANELFARLRNRDDAPSNGSGEPRGSAKVIGLAVADREADRSALEAAETGEDAPGPSTGPAGAVDAATDAGSGADGDRDPSPVVDADRVLLHKRDAVLAPTVRDLSRQLKLALSDQQNELLEASRNAKGRPDPVVSPLGDMAGVYVAAAGESLALAWSAGRRAVDPADAAAGTAADVAAESAALAGEIVDALLLRLQGGDVSEPWPVDRVRAAYREVRGQRLPELVEHHVHRAYAAGQLAVATAGTRGRWVCDTCGPDCLDNALAGPLPFGAAYPTGHAAPPAFAGCRCVLAVVDGD